MFIADTTNIKKQSYEKFNLPGDYRFGNMLL